MKFLPLLLATAAYAQTVQLASPDGKLQLHLDIHNGALTWSADYAAKPLLGPAPLGLTLYSGHYDLVARKTRTENTRWTPLYGERNSIPDHFNEISLSLRDHAAPNRPLDIIVRAYDEGIALRYRIGGTGHFVIFEENTRFSLPAGAQAWEEHGTEGDYKKVPVDAIKPACERPLTIDLGDGRFASIAEAATVNYPRMLLSPVKGHAGDLAVDLGAPIEGTAPFESPWRVVFVAQRPGDLLEHNYLIANLNPPSAIADASWIKPGKVMREVTLSTAGGKALVDFAVARGLQYIEYDAGWYGSEYDDASDATHVSPDPARVGSIPNYGGLNLPEVIAYAKQHGIGVFLYVNRRALERQAGQIFPLFEKWGVKGVKFGFVNVGPQPWTAWLHDTIKLAAQHHLMVDIHDGYRPTGFTRTYPNLLTQEGVQGNEHMPAASHNATLPFTRFLAGPADYTICYYTDRIKTTRAHQMALSVVYYSPLEFLFWYDKPSDFHGEPEVELFQKIPTVWDDTRVLDAEIGSYITVARRKAAEWYLGSITGDKPHEFQITLAFLEPGRKYAAHIYRNGATKTEVMMETRMVDSTTVLRTNLPAAGGQTVRLEPVQ